MADLFISDLDGTLLNEDQQVSAECVGTINELVAHGMRFTIATARSWASTAPLIGDLDLRDPLVLMNGAIIADPRTGATLASTFLPGDKAAEIVADYLAHDLRPLVYTVDDDGRQHVYLLGIGNEAEQAYLGNRLEAGDQRFRKVTSFDEALREHIITVNVIDLQDRVNPTFRRYAEDQSVFCHRTPDIYVPGYHWLEICHPKANKGDGVRALKELSKADRLVCFGDNYNDLPMFAVADESYATANAQPEVKRAATAVIGHHDERAVSRFLHSRAVDGLIAA